MMKNDFSKRQIVMHWTVKIVTKKLIQPKNHLRCFLLYLLSSCSSKLLQVRKPQKVRQPAVATFIIVNMIMLNFRRYLGSYNQIFSKGSAAILYDYAFSYLVIYISRSLTGIEDSQKRMATSQIMIYVLIQLTNSAHVVRTKYFFSYSSRCGTANKIVASVMSATDLINTNSSSLFINLMSVASLRIFAQVTSTQTKSARPKII